MNLSGYSISQLLFSLSLVGIGFFIANIVMKFIAALVESRFSQHQSLILQRFAYYLIITLFIFTALQQLGADLSVLWGAAGILTVAIGFASQTSASNVISGLFLLGEKPFRIGDSIRIGSTTGEVLSIDLLSVKIRTFDNLYVRIPNETIIKSEVTTLSRFPIRRFDLLVGVAYKEDLSKVKEVLFEVATNYNLCLEDPEPVYFLLGFGESSINIQFSVWTNREHYLTFKNGMIERVKNAFDQQNIEIPFPHRSLYVGSATSPFPISQESIKPTINNESQHY